MGSTCSIKSNDQGLKRSACEEKLALSDILLNYISPDTNHTKCIIVGMALHNASRGGSNGYQLFDSWSAKGKEYKGQKATRAIWSNFKRPKGRAVTIATLFYLAKNECGVTPSEVYATLALQAA